MMYGARKLEWWSGRRWKSLMIIMLSRFDRSRQWPTDRQSRHCIRCVCMQCCAVNRNVHLFYLNLSKNYNNSNRISWCPWTASLQIVTEANLICGAPLEGRITCYTHPSSVCLLTVNSKAKNRTTFKFIVEVTHVRSNGHSNFEVKRSKVEVTGVEKRVTHRVIHWGST